MASGVLKWRLLTEGVHSGDASGLVRPSFCILRQVLDRLETAPPGVCCRKASIAKCPPIGWPGPCHRRHSGRGVVHQRFPWRTMTAKAAARFTLPTTTDPLQALPQSDLGAHIERDRGRRPARLQELPANVLRPYTAFKLSLRPATRW